MAMPSLACVTLDADATPIKPAAKSLWGYGGVVRASDGEIRKIATSAKGTGVAPDGAEMRDSDRIRAERLHAVGRRSERAAGAGVMRAGEPFGSG